MPNVPEGMAWLSESFLDGDNVHFATLRRFSPERGIFTKEGAKCETIINTSVILPALGDNLVMVHELIKDWDDCNRR